MNLRDILVWRSLQFTHQTQQNMNHEQPPGGKNKGITPLPMKARMPKRWVLAKSKYGHTRQQLDNENVEGQFMHLLYKVKQLLKESQQQQIVFERDYRNCNAENSFAMHSFISGNFYLYLECDFCYNYQVEYAFNTCLIETDIKKLLDAYLLRGRVKEVTLRPDFSTFYATVLNVQELRYILTL
jgi:hypothetical protein